MCVSYSSSVVVNVNVPSRGIHHTPTQMTEFLGLMVDPLAMKLQLPLMKTKQTQVED